MLLFYITTHQASVPFVWETQCDRFCFHPRSEPHVATQTSPSASFETRLLSLFFKCDK